MNANLFSLLRGLTMAATAAGDNVTMSEDKSASVQTPSCAELMVGGQTCITAAAAAQPSPQDPYQTVYTEIINDSSETPTSSLLSIYWVPCKSKGKPCQCSLGVVMESLRGQHHSCRATRMQQWSTDVPCRVSMFHLMPGGYCIEKREFSQTCFLSGVEIRFCTHMTVKCLMYTCRKKLTEQRKHRWLLLMFAEWTCICLIKIEISKHRGRSPNLTAAPKAATTGYISC